MLFRSININFTNIIFSQILINAVKYKKNSICKINIYTTENDEEIRLYFEDDGIGIKESEIKRIFEEEPKEIVKEKAVQNMEVSKPLYAIGIKDVPAEQKEKVKKHISIEILLNLLIGASSELYKKLYDMGNCFSVPSIEYEFDKNYAHILIIGQSNEPEELYEMFKEEVEKFIQKGVNEEDFVRTKKMIYGEYVKEYDDVVNISRMFLSDYFKGINSFDYLEEINTINVEYLNQVLKDVFNEKNMILSVVKN